MNVIVEADGGSRGNPGPAGYGSVVLAGDTQDVLAERSESIGRATNNVAEYRGLIAGLTAARDVGATRVAVRMDSKLVVEQMSGRWRVKHPDMVPLAREANDLRRSFEAVTFQWIPREQNKHADRLANEAMDLAAGIPPKKAAPATPMVVGGWTPPTGPPTRLVLVRHGSTVHSAAKRFSGRNDLSLDEPGEMQAAALAKRAFGEIAAVISSPLRRTLQTAEAIAGPLGLPVRTEDDFMETDFGAWEGLSFAEARTRDPDLLSDWFASPDVAAPGGESFTAVGRRVRRGRESVLAAYPGASVIVVTHVTPIKTMVRFALDAPPLAMYRMHLDTASVSVLDYFNDATSSLRLFNDTSHLNDSAT